MYIVRGITAILAGLVLLVLSTTTPQTSNEVAVRASSENMTVLYSGEDLTHPTFGVASWVPGVTGNETVEISNSGEAPLTVSMNSGPKQPHSIAYHTHTTVTLLSGDVVYDGLYADMDITDLTVPAKETLTLNVAIQWNPPAEHSYADTIELLGLNISTK